jgi:hypothetical protein
LFDGYLVGAEQEGAVVDAAFGVWFEALRVGGAEPLGVAAGVRGGVGGDVAGGGEQW